MRKEVLIPGAICCLLSILPNTRSAAQEADDIVERQKEALQNVQLSAVFQPVTAQFNFSPPGARSLGMGGAFVALADDATAAFANPAGLLQLSQPEVSFEVRNSSFGSEFISGGHAFGDPSCIGFDQAVGDAFCPDVENPASNPGIPSTGENVGIESADGDVTAIAFLSYVHPISQKFAVAVYRHELANFEADFTSPGFYVNVPLLTALPGYQKELGKGSAPLRAFPSQTGVDLKIESIGVSAAYRPTSKLSLGLGVSTYGFDFELRTLNFGVEHFTEAAPNELAGHPFFQREAAGSVRTEATQRGDNDDIAILAGFLWQLSDRWTLGGVYREGPQHDFISRVFDREENVTLVEEVGEFRVPDVLALGLVFRPTRTSKVSFEYTSVQYSNLTEPQGVPPFGLTTNVTTDDADEVHIGFEYVFVNTKYPVAVRAGAWNDPDHRIRFDRPSGVQGPGLGGIETYEEDIQRIAASRIDRTLFRPGPNDFHYSAGVGIVFNRIQLDAAIDLSDLVDVFSFSGVFRF